MGPVPVAKFVLAILKTISLVIIQPIFYVLVGAWFGWFASYIIEPLPQYIWGVFPHLLGMSLWKIGAALGFFALFFGKFISVKFPDFITKGDTKNTHIHFTKNESGPFMDDIIKDHKIHDELHKITPHAGELKKYFAHVKIPVWATSVKEVHQLFRRDPNYSIEVIKVCNDDRSGTSSS